MNRLIATLKAQRNLSQPERIVSALAGSALLAFGLQSRRKHSGWMLLLGAGLYLRALTGNSRLYELLGVVREHPPGVPRGRGIHVNRTFVVDRPVEEVFRAWRNFENLPHFMEHLESVQMTGPNRFHWIAKAPAGMRVSWDAAIIAERPNALITWQSLPGADVDNAGSVAFRAINTGSTEVQVLLEYNPPGGRAGAILARIFHEEPGQQIDADLLRFKHMLEVAG